MLLREDSESGSWTKVHCVLRDSGAYRIYWMQHNNPRYPGYSKLLGSMVLETEGRLRSDTEVLYVPPGQVGWLGPPLSQSCHWTFPPVCPAVIV